MYTKLQTVAHFSSLHALYCVASGKIVAESLDDDDRLFCPGETDCKGPESG